MVNRYAELQRGIADQLSKKMLSEFDGLFGIDSSVEPIALTIEKLDQVVEDFRLEKRGSEWTFFGYGLVVSPWGRVWEIAKLNRVYGTSFDDDPSLSGTEVVDGYRG